MTGLLDLQHVADTLGSQFGVYSSEDFQTFVDDICEAKAVAEELHTRYGVVGSVECKKFCDDYDAVATYIETNPQRSVGSDYIEGSDELSSAPF